MNLSNIFKSKDNDEKFLEKLLRKLGFFGITICSIVLNMNFFQSLGESWVMPVCGIILVFMEIYHWINTQQSTGIRKLLHLIAWIAICATSILSVVSFGQTITAVSSDKVVEAKADEKTKNSNLQLLYKAAETAYNTAQEQIDTANMLMKTLGPYDKGPQERLSKQITDASNRQTLALKDMEKYSGVNTVADVSAKVTQEDVKKNISARIIFSKIFTEKHADDAIKGFFILFGIAMELTLSLSAMPPQKKIQKNKRKISNLLWRFINSKLQKRLIVFEKNLEKEESAKLLDETKSVNPEASLKKKKVKENLIESVEPVVTEPVESVKPVVTEPVVTEPVEQIITEVPVENDPISYDELFTGLTAEEDTSSSDEVVNSTTTLAETELKELVEEEHKAESETAFLFKENIVKTLSSEEKVTFVENTSKIFTELKNSSGELSVKQMAENIGLSIDEVKKMFKYFFNRNLLQYDDVAKRWKFKLKQDSIINYLKDKTIQY